MWDCLVTDMKKLSYCVLFLMASLMKGQPSQEQTQIDVQALLERVRQLEARVAELEQRDAPQRDKVAETPIVAAPSAAVMEGQTSIAAGPVYPLGVEEQIYPRFRMAGFSDLNYSASTIRGSRSGFSEGQFVLHINSQLSPKLSVFGELTLTARDAADTHSHSHSAFDAEVERSFIRYDYNDGWKLSFGRFHTPVNYWNDAFHHGTWLQTTVSKPEMARSFIPVHFVGSLTEGSIPVPGATLNYKAGIGNGRGGDLQRAGDAGDLNNSRAWLVNVTARPDKYYPLQIGASLYSDQILAEGRPVRESMQAVQIVWNSENPELIAEFANARHRPMGDNSTASSQAWYVQTAYRIAEGRWKPYYRFEYQHVPKSDFAFRTVPSVSGSVAGMRWDISTFAAFKFEYRKLRRSDVGSGHYGFAQTSFTF